MTENCDYLSTDVHHRRRQCLQFCFRDRTVSIPPYLRPIEEESDNEDRLDSWPVDCCEDSTDFRTTTSTAGAHDVIIPTPVRESFQHDVVVSRDDCRRPISDRAVNDVIATGQCACDEGGTYRTDENCVTHKDIVLESPSRDARPPLDKGGTFRTTGNDVTGDDVTGESESKQHWRLVYVIMASLTAFVACLTSMSPSCVIFIVTVTSLIAHHVIQS